jgi:putative DNA primase/helicase
VEDFKHVDDDSFATLRRKWARWVADNAAVLKDANPAMAAFNNRIRMNWHLQFAIADLAGGAWPKAVRKAAIKITRERREPSAGKRLLAAFYDFGAAHGPELASKDVRAWLTADPTSEWADYRGHGPITEREVSLILDAFDIHPTTVHPHGRKSERGYKLKDFEKAFKHFLPERPPINHATMRKGGKKPQK